MKRAMPPEGGRQAGRNDSSPIGNVSYPGNRCPAVRGRSFQRMMRLWKDSYSRPSPLRGAGSLSFAAHALIIGAWVAATRAPASMPSESLSNRVRYMPPPDRPSHPLGSREAVHYITLAPGRGIGPGPVDLNAQRPITVAEHSPEAGVRAVDSVTAPPVVGDTRGDSVFTILEVDSAAVRSQTSAAPAYPLDLLTNHIEGNVVARWVVDTTGFADVESLEILKSTNDGFVRAVREALPYMRFSPAKIGPMKVRMMVEQPFTFRIRPPAAPSAKP